MSGPKRTHCVIAPVVTYQPIRGLQFEKSNFKLTVNSKKPLRLRHTYNMLRLLPLSSLISKIGPASCPAEDHE